MALKALPPSLALVLAACQTTPSEPLAPAAAPATAAQGLARAEAMCGGCHAVGRTGSSSNPNAPPFHAVINQVDLRAETVAAWLRNAHNYPSEMNFTLNETQVDELVAYMLTLRDPKYRRAPD